MVTFDSAINAVIPWVVLILGLYLLYRPLKEPLSGLFSGIKDVFKRIFGRKDEAEGYGEIYQNLEYE